MVTQILFLRYQQASIRPKKGYTYLQSRLLYRNLAVDSRPFWANSLQFVFIEGEKLRTRQHTKAVNSPEVTRRSKQEISKNTMG